MTKDALGDRMKALEGVSAKRTLPNDSPIVVRIDGKRFSKFTKGLIKPFDPLMTRSLQNVTVGIMERTHAIAGYVQSDEITLIYAPQQDPIFSGRESKLNSILASMATSLFIKELIMSNRMDMVEKLPMFDCRAWSVPDQSEAINAIIWRILDCRKNSISAVYRWKVGKATMHGKDQLAMKQGFFEKYGKTWEDTYSPVEKYGSLYVRKSEIKEISAIVWDRIPDKHKPEHLACQRSFIDLTDAEGFLEMLHEDRKSLIFKE